MDIGLQSITLENFQSLRKEVVIPLSPATLLYGPNSAGKSAVLDAFSLLKKLLKGEGDDIENMVKRWSHKDSQSSKQLSLGIGFKAATWTIAHLNNSTELALTKLPNYFTGEENSLISVDDPQLVNIELKAKWEHHTESPEISITINEKFALAISQESDDGLQEIRVATWPFGRAPDKLLEELGYDNNNLEYFTLSDHIVTITQDGVQITQAFSDNEDYELNNTLRMVAKYFLELAADCLHYPTIIDAARGVIPNSSLSFFSNLTNNNNYPPHTFSSDVASRVQNGEAPLEYLLISRIGRSYFKEYHDHHYQSAKPTQEAKIPHEPVPQVAQDSNLNETKSALTDAVTQFFSQHDGVSPKASNETLYQFVNRSLGEHLFIDQGYSLMFDVCEVLPDRASKAGMDFWRQSGDFRNFKGSSCAWMTCSLQDKAGRAVNFEDVGTGISCVLPVLAGLHGGFSFSQQPELHLHPALQSALGDVVVEAANRGNSVHILETHSEYLLLRLLKRIRQTTMGKQPKGSPLRFTPDQLSILYFNPQPDGSTEVKRIRISDEGEFLDRWPRGFFEERSKDLFDE